MKFKMKISCLALCSLAGAVWTVLFWLAVTVLPVGASIAALVGLSAATVFSLKDKKTPQAGLNLASWFGGLAVSAVIEHLTDFPHVLLPEWNGGTGLGVILLLPIFIAAGAITLTAAMIISLFASRNK